jgi:hypothetical protein
MSVYTQEKELLDWVDTLLSGDTTSKVSFMCYCRGCVNPIEYFDTTQEARQWLEKHHNHSEPLIDIRWEGIRAPHKPGRTSFTPFSGSSFGALDELAIVMEKIHKLHKLAEGTSFPHEASVARRKIRELEAQLDQYQTAKDRRREL